MVRIHDGLPNTNTMANSLNHFVPEVMSKEITRRFFDGAYRKNVLTPPPKIESVSFFWPNAFFYVAASLTVYLIVTAINGLFA